MTHTTLNSNYINSKTKHTCCWRCCFSFRLVLSCVFCLMPLFVWFYKSFVLFLFLEIFQPFTLSFIIHYTHRILNHDLFLGFSQQHKKNDIVIHLSKLKSRSPAFISIYWSTSLSVIVKVHIERKKKSCNHHLQFTGSQPTQRERLQQTEPKASGTVCNLTLITYSDIRYRYPRFTNKASRPLHGDDGARGLLFTGVF